jgi:tetratricopeptide (TPR) repeat protein
MSNRIRSFLIALFLVTISRPLAAQESDAVSALVSKGQSLLQQGHAAEAIKVYEAAVEQAKKDHGADHERTLQVQSGLGLSLLAAGRVDDGVKVCETVAARAEAKYGPNHPQTYVTLCDLGKVYKAAKRYDDAIKCLQRSLKGLDATFAPNQIINECVDSLIDTCTSAGRYVDTETYLRRKITLIEAKHRPDHPDAVTATIRVSVMMISTNRLADAAVYLRTALDRLTARAGADEVQISRLLIEVAKIEITKGRYADAEKLLGDARGILEKRVGPKAPETWKVLGALRTGKLRHT